MLADIDNNMFHVCKKNISLQKRNSSETSIECDTNEVKTKCFDVPSSMVIAPSTFVFRREQQVKTSIHWSFYALLTSKMKLQDIDGQ